MGKSKSTKNLEKDIHRKKEKCKGSKTDVR